MAKKKTAAENDSVVSVNYDASTLSAICLKVKAEGFVPQSALLAEFGADKTTQGIAVLYRDFRMFREVRRPWGEDGKEALGYEWADRRFSRSEAKKIEGSQFNFLIQFAPPLAARYSDYETVSVKCRYITPILGSVPTKVNGDTLNVFERDIHGNALILGYHQRAMASKALPMIGKEASIARRIGWSVIRLHLNGNIRTAQHAVVDEMGNGLGIKNSEQIVDGTEFTIRAKVPTSMLSMAEFIEMVREAGQFVRLSPGRSAGFGDFEVLGAE